MNIKEQIKTIIDDYSDASLIANEYNKYNGYFKGLRATENTWNFVKHPFNLKIKGLLASLNIINIHNTTNK
tara:strand:+ start:595 stop:807 length:213 start_codon:yes stop_codon:yes gene_type:complete